VVGVIVGAVVLWLVTALLLRDPADPAVAARRRDAEVDAPPAAP